MPDVSQQCLYMLYITLAVVVMKFFSSLCWIRIGARMLTHVKNEIFTHIMQYDVQFYDTHSIGLLLSILGEDAAVIQECFGATKNLQIQQLGQFVIGFIMIVVNSWKLGLMLLCIVSICVAVMLSFHPHIKKNGIKRFIHIADSTTIAEETIAAIRTVRGYNREEEEIARFSKEAETASQYEKKTVIFVGTMFGTVMIFVWGLVLCILYYSTTLIGKEENCKIFAAGTVFSIFGYAMMSCFGIVGLENSIQGEQRAITASTRIISLIKYQTSINFEGGRILDNFGGHIEFKNVSFSYPSRPNVFAVKSISFEVKPGQTVAIVGHSGSGKSTCIQLIERYYDVSEGMILVDGVDIKDVDPHWLHRKLALVSQEPNLFQASVRENVLYGIQDKNSKTDDDVWAALEQANAKKFVLKFDNQLDQLVGDRGSTVSDGQRQRIAIARAVIKDHVVLLCDEATSALESESEKKVQIALDKILETKTGIIVAHRLTTIRNAKIIYVFDAGEIVEIGNHEELIEKNGVYYDLVKRQLQKENDIEEQSHSDSD